MEILECLKALCEYFLLFVLSTVQAVLLVADRLQVEVSFHATPIGLLACSRQWSYQKDNRNVKVGDVACLEAS